MARARNIKPGFFMNEYLGTCDPLEQLLFSGLWLLADREGRLEYRPLRIKAEIFPYRENLDMSRFIRNLSDNGFLNVYEVNGKQYIQIENFEKHQNPHKNEKPSELPGPNDGKPVDTGLAGSSKKIGTTSEKIGTTRADSLIPDSLIPDSPTTERESPKRDPLHRFAEFWSVWPKKVSRQSAESAWKKLKPSDELIDQIIDHVRERAATDSQWLKDNGQFIPHASTFLNQKRWEDSYEREGRQQPRQATQGQPQAGCARPSSKPFPGSRLEREWFSGLHTERYGPPPSNVFEINGRKTG